MSISDARKCKAHRADGNPCKNPAISGGDVCRNHGGSIKRVKQKALVRAEVTKWGLGDAHIDPAEVLLRLVSQSAARAEFYGHLLQEAYEAAERLRVGHEARDLLIDNTVDEDGMPASVAQAREDLDRIFNTGGVAALIGRTYSDAHDGSIYVTGEQIRGLADLEAKERDRCANFATKAVAAGLAERQVRLAERQGAMILQVLTAVFDELGLSESQLEVAPDVIRRQLDQLQLAG